jgi:hypothetical protein
MRENSNVIQGQWPKTSQLHAPFNEFTQEPDLNLWPIKTSS